MPTSRIIGEVLESSLSLFFSGLVGMVSFFLYFVVTLEIILAIWTKIRVDNALRHIS